MDLEYVNISDLSDAEIASRMRKMNYEKFKTLVRMHLSFELDLNTDEFDLPCHGIVYEDRGKLKKWNRMSKKPKNSSIASSAAGCTANVKSTCSVESSPTESLHQQIDAGFLFHLQEMKSFLLLEKNIIEEGIFRKTGSASRQNELRSNIQNDKPLELEHKNYTVHDCATVFKGYLKELPEPLLTDAHYPAHLQIAPLCLGASFVNSSTTSSGTNKKPVNPERLKREQRLLNSMQLLLLLLPEENRQLLHEIIEILHETAKMEHLNKMSPENLATLFAPHLICPRKLPPEALHYVAKKMTSIIAYMIIKGFEIFAVPAKLATDIRAYFMERKRKKTMSPEQMLDESISDISTVNTVYTFVDREKTAAAHTANNTDTELAQLYAHIQSMPESSKKRRLIKQFNKQNGQGTPLQVVVMNRIKNSDASRATKSIGDSIKKHIFHKGIMSRTPKRTTAAPLATMGLETPSSSMVKNSKSRVLFQSPSTTNTLSIASSTFSHESPSASNICASNTVSTTSTPYAIKTHPLQKSISSTSLLFANNTSTKSRHHIKHNALYAQEDCKSSSSTSSLCSSTYSNDGFSSQTQKYTNNKQSGTVSAPVSRQVSSNLTNNVNNSPTGFSNCTASSTSSLAVTHSQHMRVYDANCCTTPLKLITEAAKNLLGAAAGGGGVTMETKSVTWNNQKHLIDIYNDDSDDYDEISYPSTPINQRDLKSRFRSEPNLSYIMQEKTYASMATSAEAENTPTSKCDNGINKSLTRKLMKGVSMSNLKFSFTTLDSTKRLVDSVSTSLGQRSGDDHNQKPYESHTKNILLEDLDDETFEDNPDDQVDDSTGNELDESADDSEDDDNNNKENKFMISSTSSLINRTNIDDIDGGSSSSSELPGYSTGRRAGISYHQRLLQQSGGMYRNLDAITSTPSLLLGRRSMSPITKSAQRMPKAMQESIMTPRSRKPVMVLTTNASSSDQNQTLCQTDLSSFREEDEEDHLQVAMSNVHSDNATSLGSYSDILRRKHLQKNKLVFMQQLEQQRTTSSSSETAETDECNSNEITEETKATNDQLSNHFKQYLLRRSVLTESPADSSFLSEPEDFGSPQEIEPLNESQLSPSLLFCLDGNEPDDIDFNNKREENDGESNVFDTTIPNIPNIQNVNTPSRHYLSSRFATNPFIMLNNARKRAATTDDCSSKNAAAAKNQQKVLPQSDKSHNANKENRTGTAGDHRLSKKFLISECPDETSF